MGWREFCLRGSGGICAERSSATWLKVVAALLGVTTDDAVCVMTDGGGTAPSPAPGNRDAVSAATAGHGREGGIAARGRGWAGGEVTCTANRGM